MASIEEVKQAIIRMNIIRDERFRVRINIKRDAVYKALYRHIPRWETADITGEMCYYCNNHATTKNTVYTSTYMIKCIYTCVVCRVEQSAGWGRFIYK